MWGVSERPANPRPAKPRFRSATTVLARLRTSSGGCIDAERRTRRRTRRSDGTHRISTYNNCKRPTETDIVSNHRPIHDDLADAPPSVKLVYVLLSHDDLAPATPSDLVTLTDLSSESVRVALRELESHGLVDQQPHQTDRRETLYRATTGGSEQ